MLVCQNRWDHLSKTRHKDALSSLGLVPSIRYFTRLLASPIFYIGLDTKQTQTIQHKAQNLLTYSLILNQVPLVVTANRASMN